MNVGVAPAAQRLQVRPQFIEDADIRQVMDLAGGTLLAALANSSRPAERSNAALAPERAAQVPLISRFSIEGYDFGHAVLREKRSREQLCNLLNHYRHAVKLCQRLSGKLLKFHDSTPLV